MREPKLLKSEEVYRSKTFSLFRETYEDPEGRRQFDLDIIKHRGAVAVLPLLGSDEVVLERQFRYSLKRWILEVPAGTLEQGESEEEAAKRELKEETGYEAKNLTKIGALAASPGYDDEVIRLYVARVSGEPVAQSLDKDEVINLVVLSRADLLEKIKSGDVFDGKTVAITLLAKELGYL